MHYVFIYNPKAGDRKASAKYRQYLSEAKNIPAPHSYELRPTMRAGDVELFARETVEEYGDEAVVAVIGGDGSLSEAANALAGTSTPLLVLPAGRGNDFSRSLYTKEHRQAARIVDVIKALSTKDVKTGMSIFDIDLLEVNAEAVSYPHNTTTFEHLKRYCLNVVSLGFDSNSVIVADKLGRKFSFIGTNVYYLGAVISSFQKMLFHGNFKINGTDLKNRAYSLTAICNARFYGSGFQPNPNANLRDGILEVVLSKRVNLFHILFMARRFKKGKIDSLHRYLDQYKGESLKVESTDGDPLIVTIDGEPFFCERMEITAKQKMLKLMMPAGFALPSTLR